MGSQSHTMPSYHTTILAIISLAIPSLSQNNTTARNMGDYPACMQDSDCTGLGGGYRCFQYMCYPWEQGGSLEKCQVKDDCKGKVGGEDGECFRHPDRKTVLCVWPLWGCQVPDSPG